MFPQTLIGFGHPLHDLHPVNDVFKPEYKGVRNTIKNYNDKFRDVQNLRFNSLS